MGLQQVLLVGRSQHLIYASRLKKLYLAGGLYWPDYYNDAFDDSSFSLLMMYGPNISAAMTCQITMTATGMPLLYVSLLASNPEATVRRRAEVNLSYTSQRTLRGNTYVLR